MSLRASSPLTDPLGKGALWDINIPCWSECNPRREDIAADNLVITGSFVNQLKSMLKLATDSDIAFLLLPFKENIIWSQYINHSPRSKTSSIVIKTIGKKTGINHADDKPNQLQYKELD